MQNRQNIRSLGQQLNDVMPNHRSYPVFDEYGVRQSEGLIDQRPSLSVVDERPEVIRGSIRPLNVDFDGEAMRSRYALPSHIVDRMPIEKRINTY